MPQPHPDLDDVIPELLKAHAFAHAAEEAMRAVRLSPAATDPERLAFGRMAALVTVTAEAVAKAVTAAVVFPSSKSKRRGK